MSVSIRTRPVLAVSLAAFLLAAGSADATTPTPAPAWQIVSVSLPTALSSEAAKLDELQLRVENIGEGATDGSTIIVTDTLPPGVTTSSSHFLGSVDGGTYWSCGPAGAGQEKIECSHSGVATPFAQLPPIAVPVQVGSVAPGTVLTNDVSVEGGGAARVESSSPVLVEPTIPTLFGLAEGFKSYPADPAGAFETQAAGHAGSYNTSFDLNSVFEKKEGSVESIPAGRVKDIVVDLPVGFVGDPEALPRCPQDLLASDRGESASNCPANTQVGIITWSGRGVYHETEPIYNLVPGPDEPAVFGFVFAGQRVLMHASVRTGSDYGVRVGIPGAPTIVGFQGAEVTFFGNPALEDGEAPPGKMFFTNPSACSGEPLRTVIHADSWEDPAQVPLNPDGSLDLNAADFSEPQWHTSIYEAPAVTGCEALTFDPSFSLQPTSAETGSPSGATVDLHIPQENITEPETLPSPDLKKAVVTLPEGLVVDPSAADGLQACSEAQIALQSTYAPTCPEASKLGSVEVITPLLEHPLTGGVYLAREVENPFGSLIALYVVVEGAGVVVKVPGKVETDPLTGRLTATFDNNPQLPFEDFKLDFKDGPRASLTTPGTCGVRSVEAQLTPYSAPQSGPPADPSSPPFDLVSGPNGSGCVNSLSEEPDTPGFSAGTLEPKAGAYSPFVLKLTREDGSQIFKGLDVSLPPGLLGRIAGVEECSQAGIEAAEHRDRLGEGALEQAGPSCPAGSEVGTVTVGAGSGDPLYVGGHAYLAGPYKGAPFSLVIVTPAVAGPFDLGVVVVRSALYIDPQTAQVTVKSDPIPTILDGIPLDIRSIMVNIDRSGFTLNPTNCAPMAIAATVIAQSSQAGLSDRFQVGDCPSLPFAPSFAASTSGRTSKADGASLSVSVAQKPGEANIHKVDVQLPLVLPARLTTLQKACTEAQFDANPAGCPEASDIGTATAVTPLLSVPLTGPAYLVSHGGAAFPDVEFVLQGDNVLIDLDGKTDIKKGITYSKFETVPDAPISSFVTSFPEGPHSALAANASLCATTKTVSVRRRVTIRSHGHTTHRTKTVKETVAGIAPSLSMPTTIVAQSGAQVAQSTKITVTGCPKAATVKKTTRKTKADGKKR